MCSKVLTYVFFFLEQNLGVTIQILSKIGAEQNLDITKKKKTSQPKKKKKTSHQKKSLRNSFDTTVVLEALKEWTIFLKQVPIHCQLQKYFFAAKMDFQIVLVQKLTFLQKSR